MFRKYKVVWVSLAVVAAVILGIMGVGAVMAVTPLNPIDENGVISAAYQEVEGILRLVNGDEDVRESEVYISWNQEGPQGPEGPAGPQGPPGGIDEASEQEIKAGICAICESLELVEEAPGFCFAIKQRQTIDLINALITANAVYLQDYHEYAPSLEPLEAEYGYTIEDGWGNTFVYYRDTPNSYSLTSLGSDGVEGPPPPDPWFFGESGESDIIYAWPGGWLQVPEPDTATKQHQTIDYMAGIQTGNMGYCAKHSGEYAPSLEVLKEAGYVLTIEDGWGNTFVYYRDTPSSYSLTSLGCDGVEGPPPPDPWFFGESAESDIILTSTGGWLQAPE